MLADSTVTLSGSGNSSNTSQPSAAAIAAASAAIAALSPQSQASSSSLSISPVPTTHPSLPQLQQFLLSPESIGIPGTGAVNTTNGPNSQAATAAAALMMNPAAYLAAPFLYGNNALRYSYFQSPYFNFYSTNFEYFFYINFRIRNISII